MMRNMSLVDCLVLVLCISSAVAFTNPSEFQKKIFDFKYPPEGLYSISLGSSESMMNNFIRAYGDFNNDLRTDYVAIGNNNYTTVFIFNTKSFIFQEINSFPPVQGCIPLNYYLYDSDGDSNLDITVWGINDDGLNCLYILIQTNQSFIVNMANTYNFTETTQPFLIQYNRIVSSRAIKTYVLVLYNNDANVLQRQIYLYLENSYNVSSWAQFFESSIDYSSIPFSNQHWNTFADITNDCYPDIIITNANNSQLSIEFWIYNTASSKFTLRQVNSTSTLPAFNSFNLIDINYDAALDIIVSTDSAIYVYFNQKDLTADSQLCVPGSYSFSFNWQQPVIVGIQEGLSLSQQNLQFADLNIDGYPEMMLIANNTANQTTILVFENKLQTDNRFEVYQSKYVFNNLNNVVSVGFFDILQNGIVDIIANLGEQNYYVSQAYYNNYLYQNNFYLKGYGIDGQSTNQGSQITGISFYWSNSVGNTNKLAYLTQIPQTAYYSYSMPYVVTGLGRANNYIEAFTVARLGVSRAWSPIIPNSQLAVFTGQTSLSNWAIKIFIMPADTLIYVVIVCIFILTILGIILVILKWKKKPIVEPLLADL